MAYMYRGFYFVLRINPITGRWEEAKMNPTDEMSDDQKEYEAMRLVNDLDKLQRYAFSNYKGLL